MIKHFYNFHLIKKNSEEGNKRKVQENCVFVQENKPVIFYGTHNIYNLEYS